LKSSWRVYIFLFISNTFGITIYTRPGLELSYPYLLKLNFDKIAAADSEDYRDEKIFGVAGIHLGIFGAGIHAGPDFGISSLDRITFEASSSFFWASLDRDLARQYIGGVTIGLSHLISDRDVVLPIIFKLEFLKKIPFSGNPYFGASIGTSI
jgi:hypothetical protein